MGDLFRFKHPSQEVLAIPRGCFSRRERDPHIAIVKLNLERDSPSVFRFFAFAPSFRAQDHIRTTLWMTVGVPSEVDCRFTRLIVQESVDRLGSSTTAWAAKLR